MRNNPLIIFVHGLTGSKDEMMYLAGESFFIEKWFDVVRFNLYGTAPGEKKLSEVSLKDHIADVNEKIRKAVNQGYEKIFLIGHSFGGLTILYADLEFISKIVMRDPSIGWKETLEDVYHDEKGYYIDRGDGIRFDISEEIYHDFNKDPNQHLEQIKKLSLPIKIIGAEFGLPENSKKYYLAANEPKALTIVSWASHCFLEEWKIEELLNETYQRLQ